MHSGKYVFAQLIEFIPRWTFEKNVEKYSGNRYIKHFSCWNQMLCLIFGQLSNRESLSDTVLTINSHVSKLYHLGFGKSVSKSNLAQANERRDCRIIENFAYELVCLARKICLGIPELETVFKGDVYAFDSTIIELCLSIFWWAKFRKNKGAVKMHTMFDVRTQIPNFFFITTGKIHDVNIMDKIDYEHGSFYLFDKGYTDFKRLYVIHQCHAFFVIRAKDNIRYKRMYSNPKSKEDGILLDQIIKLEGFYVSKDYPEKLRLVKYFDKELNFTWTYLTNNFELPAKDIAYLYKQRWQIELFFKWIKQHLKIKSFWGTTPNAVKTQLYTAIISYTLVAIVKSKLNITKTIYEILQILSVSLFDKTPIKELLTNNDLQNFKEPVYKQLTIF
jgi:hypothetical protein